MTTVFDISLVFSPHEWVEALHRHCTNTGIMRIRSLVYDPGVLHGEDTDACIISDSHPALSAGLVQLLHDAGHIVIGVCNDTDSAREYLVSVGVDAIFSANDSAEDLGNNIYEFLTSTETSNPDKTNNLNHNNFTYLSSKQKDLNSSQQICVVSPGGTGATEFACLLSSRLVDCLLIDSNFEHPSLAPRLGLNIEPHLLNALESAHNNPNEFLENTQRTLLHGVIVGASHPSFTRDIRTYEMDSLLDAARTHYSHVVYDLGRISEDTHFFELQRNIFLSSDVIFIIGEPTPIGVLRILEITATLHTHINSSNCSPTICVILNMCPKNKDIIRDTIQELDEFEQISHIWTFDYINDMYLNVWKSEIIQPRRHKKVMNNIVIFLEDLSRRSHNNVLDNRVFLEKENKVLA